MSCLVFLLVTWLPSRSTLFPYTTLFRSVRLPLHGSATGFLRLHYRDLLGVDVGVAHRRGFPTFRGGRRAFSFRAIGTRVDRKSTRLDSSHTVISYAVFCLKKKKTI